MILTGMNGTKYPLDLISPIGSGGEGDIFRVIGVAGAKVAKIYKPGASTPELEKKLNIMIKYPPDASVLSQVAWPLDIVYDSNGKFCGFIMPELHINAELGDIYKYPSALPISAHQKINIAQNICVVISQVHKSGYVFGDFNPRNIGLDKDTGLVSFLDTDTYHVADKERGATYRCNVCAPGYAAPELLEKCSDYVAQNPGASKDAYALTPLPTFTKETDNFALAIHIFKLLMNGYTPFGGIIESASVSQPSPGVGDAAVRRNSYCFRPGYKHQSVAIPPLEVLPEEIADLFTLAFIAGKYAPKQRPSAVEWYDALRNYEKNLAKCLNNELHQYDKKNKTCPLCEADQRFAAVMGETGSSRTLKQSAYAAKPAATPAPSAPKLPPASAYVQNYSTPPKATAQSAPQPQTALVSPFIEEDKKTAKLLAITGTIITAVCGLVVVISSYFGYFVDIVLTLGTAMVLGIIILATAGILYATAVKRQRNQLTPQAETPALPSITDIKTGDIIRFGDHNWRVLNINGNHVKILTEKIIFNRVYHSTSWSRTWATSNIRAYLNSTFFDSFSDADRARIQETTIINSNNQWFGTRGGYDTTDKIFLLSIEEVVRYFGDSGQLENRPFGSWKITDNYNNARKARNAAGAASWWWLRSPGGLPYIAANVVTSGFLFMYGDNVSLAWGGVRPALWLRLDS